jgi:D-beta-D-heptose 7-phosphate kinase/D-beta-D-heptose 1-phosphate adenosyltransferase
MSLFESGPKRAITTIPTQAKEVFDVTGAGDTVISLMALGLASGAKLNEAAYIANAGAGVVVGKLGTATTTIMEIRKALSEATRLRL